MFTVTGLFCESGQGQVAGMGLASSGRRRSAIVSRACPSTSLKQIKSYIESVFLEGGLPSAREGLRSNRELASKGRPDSADLRALARQDRRRGIYSRDDQLLAKLARTDCENSFKEIQKVG